MGDMGRSGGDMGGDMGEIWGRDGGRYGGDVGEIWGRYGESGSEAHLPREIWGDLGDLGDLGSGREAHHTYRKREVCVVEPLYIGVRISRSQPPRMSESLAEVKPRC